MDNMTISDRLVSTHLSLNSTILEENTMQRLDTYLAKLYPHYSRSQLQQWIRSGAVTVDSRVITKPSCLIAQSAIIILGVQEPAYVSRAGFKLEKALDHFGVVVRNKIALDAGLSTGGFTDCLLQRGIKKVYGVDVGSGQVHDKITKDSRVIVMENTHINALPDVVEKVDLVTLDLSFISVLRVISSVTKVLKPAGELIVLIKPQFEVGKHAVGRRGIVKNESEHARAVTQVVAGVSAAGFIGMGVIDSPITGGDGNKEFLGYFICAKE